MCHITNTNRLLVRIGGGPHVSELYLVDVSDQNINQIPFTDPNNYLSNSGEIYKPELIYQDGGTHAESFTIEDSTLHINDLAVNGQYGTRIIDLNDGQLIGVNVLYETWESMSH